MSSWFTAPLLQAMPWPQLQSFGSGIGLSGFHPTPSMPQQVGQMPVGTPQQSPPQMAAPGGGGGGGSPYPSLPPFAWPGNPWQVSGDYPPVIPQSGDPGQYVPPQSATPGSYPPPVPGGYSGVWGQLGGPNVSTSVTGQLYNPDPQTGTAGVYTGPTDTSNPGD